ncbi:hypothetical protein [Enterococcus faecium]|uniref:hypothetical protein n=1 Tax=Enterococcus faecium TaxID=1352 RepID=UPI001F50F791|nr:hypothetical protein [Enterococcus faecium]
MPNGIHHPPIEDGRLLPNSVKRLSVAQYINDMQLTGKEKACLLGSMKNFEQLRRTYRIHF